MYSVTRLLDVVAGERDRVVATARAAATATGADIHLVEPTLPGSRNGGDVLVHLRFGSIRNWWSAADCFTDALQDPAITRINGAGYAGSPTRDDDGTVYRTLLLRVSPEVSTDTVARFEGELRSMTRFIPSIRAWQLSRVDDAIGDSQWTHVFEQEFNDVDGLIGPYLMHPIHWAVVDRWFDPECPDVIVRDRLCHSYCQSDRGVLRS
ncbi:Dabb family protein [Mycobacterium sp.]|uniref:Dabb family protein n=1 Tax=Mycobacterium sp. TaxID=1785 RepID=UPI003BB003C4